MHTCPRPIVAEKKTRTDDQSRMPELIAIIMLTQVQAWNVTGLYFGMVTS